MKLSIIGSGYVGLITGSCLADLGFQVTCIDKDEALCGRLSKAVVTIHEAGIEPLLKRALARGAIRFSSTFGKSIAEASMVFLAVGTPSLEDSGEADLGALYGAVREMAPFLSDGVTIVVKSTVPVGTSAAVGALMSRLRPDLDFAVASNPEFLREGSAIEDFMNADRIICGVRDDATRAKFQALYRGLVGRGTRLAFTTPENAELSKYASNAFLAMKITFINEIADICEVAGADIDHVAELMGMDRRIGSGFLKAGPGYGGSCFPKDARALLATATRLGADASIVRATISANDRRKMRLAEEILGVFNRSHAGVRIAVLGVTFKAGTDDVRDAPSLEIIPHLQAAGVEIHAHDPKGMANAAAQLPGVVWHQSAHAAAQGADAVVILTEWPEYGEMALAGIASAMRGNRLFDLRNIVSPAAAEAAGLVYRGIGRRALPKDERQIELANVAGIASRDDIAALARQAIPLPDDGNAIGAR